MTVAIRFRFATREIAAGICRFTRHGETFCYLKIDGREPNPIGEFADRGTGIAAEDLQKVFTPFYSTKESGTGLGLSIVYKIVEQHHGSIEIENRKEGGAICRLRLPVRPPEARGDA